MRERLKRIYVLAILFLLIGTAITIELPQNASANGSSSEIEWKNTSTPLVIFRIILEGEHKYEYKIDGGTVYEVEGEVVEINLPPLSDGVHTLSVRAKNGDWSDWKDIPVYVDTTGPNAPIFLDGITDWSNDNTPTFSWLAAWDQYSGVSGYYWYIDSGPKSFTTETSVTIPPQVDGTHNIKVQSVDNVGNLGGIATQMFYIDTTPPDAPEFTEDTDNYFSSHNPTLHFSVPSDENDIEGYRYQYDGSWLWKDSTTQSGTEALTLPYKEDGIYALYIKTEDEAGNIGNTRIYSIKIDSTPPELVSAPNDNIEGFSTENIRTFSWSATDNMGSGIKGYYYNVDNSDNSFTSNSFITLPPIIDGSHLFSVRVVDNVGHYSDWSSHDFHILANPVPTPIPDDSVEGWSNDNTPTFTWEMPCTGADIDGYYWTIASKSWTFTEDTSVTIDPIADGIHTFYVKARDVWGNEGGIGEHIFYIDVKVPDNPDQVEQRIGKTQSNIWQNKVADPTFKWSYQSSDDDGDSRDKRKSRSSTVIGPPVVEDRESEIDGYNFYWGTDSDGISEYYTEKDTFDPPEVTDGTYYLRLRTLDGANNRGDWETSYIFKYDGTPPTNPTKVVQKVGDTESGVWQNRVNKPVFKWSGAKDETSGVSGYYVYWGSNPDGTSTNLIKDSTFESEELKEGTYYLRLQTIDAAENTAEWITIYEFKFYKDPSLVTNSLLDDLKALEVPEYAKKSIGKAVESIEKAKSVIEKGKLEKSFEHFRKAIEKLLEAQKSGGDTQEIIDEIIIFADDMVINALNQAIEKLGEDDKKVIDAQNKYSEALKEIDKDEYINALEFFEKAYSILIKALK